MQSAILLVLLTLLSFAAAEKCDFHCTLNQHIKAIQNRDFDSFAATITDGDTLNFLLPNGAYFDSTRVYLKLIEGWFAEDGWEVDVEIINTFVGSDMGIALLLLDYREANRNGKPYHLRHYLSLVFRKENNRWLLVHDQNTKVEQQE